MAAFFHTVGQKYHDFVVTKIQDIHELHCQLIELTHEPSKARVMHIANDDPENMFCLSFQTLPQTSNGVAHILEHTVLCGSKKFPVKDPFFAMQRRSLNTFMNALTGADFTCYPAASQVSKDFYNLLEVYLDAVFHPNLNEFSFLQEGHRLEFAIPNDPQSDLEYKGIVFNEMKGALTGSTTRLTEAISQALFPDLTYGINSGGDPKDIPKLTYEELCEFHRTFYHPSRCLFFFYGNMPLKQHLDFIAEHTLDGLVPVAPLPPLPLQPRFTKPVQLTQSYPISADEDPANRTLIAFGWLTCHILEQQELLALNILEIILLDTDASPLKKALLQSGLCKQVSCYMEDDVTEVPLVIILKGCNPENADALEEIIKTTLNEVIKEGIPLNLVENAMHQLEFYRSEISGDFAPFGLSLFMRSALLKQHGGDPESGLKIHTYFEEVRRQNLEDPHYFINLIKKYLLDNAHMARIVLTPSTKLAPKELAEEKAVLAVIKEQLTSEQTNQIIEKAKALVAFQHAQEEEDVDILPKITFQDIPHAVRVYPLVSERINSLNIFHHSCFTNEIVYADLVFNLPYIPEKDLPYARLMTTLMAQLGCDGRNYEENLDYIQANTGGISASFALHIQATDYNQFFPSLYLRGKALHRKTEKLLTLMKEMATHVDFSDVRRLKELIFKQYTALQSSLNQNALKYAINLSASSLAIPSKITNDWYGLEYFWTIQELAQNFDAHAESLIAKLTGLHALLFGGEKVDLTLSCDAAMYDEMRAHHFYGLTELPQPTSESKWKSDYSLPSVHSQGRIIASPVAFIGKVLKTVSYVHPDAPALNIAAFLCENVTLHAKLREQGGAYGGGTTSNAMAGNFYFYSYRDPNIVSSIEAFKLALNDLLSGKFDDTDLEEAKIEMIQSMDSPISPGSRADLAYGWMREGKTTEIRQAFREKILALKASDVIQAANKHLLPQFDNAPTVVFSGRELLEKENGKFTQLGLPPLPLLQV